VELHVEAATWGELLAEAGRGVAELELRGVPARRDGGWREVAITGSDRGAVLVNWLNELVYLAEAELWVAIEFEPLVATATRCVIRARGKIVPELSGFVKAVTHHRVAVREVPGGLVAEVIVDV
jgi:SHS2 domain-containing protein